MGKIVGEYKEFYKQIPKKGRGKQMKKVSIFTTSLMGILFIFPLELSGQKKINRIINDISNDKLQFEVAKIGTTRFVDSVVVTTPKYLAFVDSVNFESLANRDKNKLINRLVPMLTDSTKDWYANVLLYQLTQKDASSLIVVENRNEWIEKSKDNDLNYWKSYFDKQRKFQ